MADSTNADEVRGHYEKEMHKMMEMVEKTKLENEELKYQLMASEMEKSQIKKQDTEMRRMADCSSDEILGLKQENENLKQEIERLRAAQGSLPDSEELAMKNEIQKQNLKHCIEMKNLNGWLDGAKKYFENWDIFEGSSDDGSYQEWYQQMSDFMPSEQ